MSDTHECYHCHGPCDCGVDRGCAGCEDCNPRLESDEAPDVGPCPTCGVTTIDDGAGGVVCVKCDAPAARAALIQRYRLQRAEIEQIFTDVASWNENVRKPGEAPIDPDPDGLLHRMANGIDEMLAREDARAKERA